MAIIVGILGWVGAATVLIGYLLFSAGKLRNGPLYQTLNLVGSVCVYINVFAHHAWPSTIVNGIWAVIAGAVLVQRIRSRRAAVRSGGSRSQDRSTRLEATPEPPTTTLVLPVMGPSVRTTTAPVPMAESVPVVTAAIAVVVATAMRDARFRALSEQLQPDHEPQR